MPIINITEGSGRVVIEAVTPKIDGGRFPIKRIIGEKVAVEADVFADGHDIVACRLLYRYEGESVWNERPMKHIVNDRFQGDFTVSKIGQYYYTIEGWIDTFATWLKQIKKRIEAGQSDSMDFIIGAELIEAAAGRAAGRDRDRLCQAVETLKRRDILSDRKQMARMARFEKIISHLMARYPDRSKSTRYGKELNVAVDRLKARFSTWYEIFPRSWAHEAGKHSAFDDILARLPYFAEMGFDVLYFPPIHPIGETLRKGRNNVLECQPGDVGCPWAIGSTEGGHKAVHKDLGSLESFRRLVKTAQQDYGIEIALDIALQCSPDHPYLKEHPEWFKKRPDGTIQYAENPPKKYQDIYPFDFECIDWKSLWLEVRSIFAFWCDQSVRIFRVDNPHTKPFAFWEWLIGGLKAQYPDLIFLSEAFTRPKVMNRLAKLGFTQSYTYFTWRNDKWELESYFKELTQSPSREYFRPNLWTNTPDILHEYLQTGGRPAFIARLVLAATAGASYGMYGPAFELCVNTPRETGSEEYLDSEKYEIKNWDLDAPHSLRPLIATINRIRRENPALQSDWSINGGLQIHPIDNPLLIFYSKRTDDCSNIILVAVNLDPFNTQIGWVDLPLEEFRIRWDEPYAVYDLLTGERYIWHGGHNYIELNPYKMPAHIFKIVRL